MSKNLDSQKNNPGRVKKSEYPNGSAKTLTFSKISFEIEVSVGGNEIRYWTRFQSIS